MSPNYENLLEKIGLDVKEAKVYLAALTLRSAIASDIAKESGISRTTTYGILNELAQKGLVSKIEKSGVLKFNAENPELLESYVENQKTNLDNIAKEIKSFLPDLKSLQREKEFRPDIEFFEGKNAIASGFLSDWKDLREMAKRGVPIYIYGRTDRVLEAWPGFVKYAKKRMRTGVKIKKFISDEKEVKEMAEVHKEHYQIKRLPLKYVYQGGAHVYEDKIILFDFENLVSVIIKNKSLAQMMRVIFEFMWDNAK